MADPPNVVRRTSVAERLVAMGIAFLKPSAVSGGAYPFPAGEPLKPTLEPGRLPRAFVPSPHQNLAVTPRGQPGKVLSPFASLKALADFDVVRCAIADLKGQIRGMNWSVEVRDAFEDRKDELEPQIARAEAWLERPDPIHDLDFDGWLDRALEEVLVTDALTILPRRTRGGEFLGLEAIDGTTILPLVDDRGAPPWPPKPAYHQVVHGMPETAFALDELWSLPMNRRTDSPYGRSPVEDVILTVNLALRHALHNLGYYTDGNLPESLYVLPEGWTAQQIDEYQQLFDDALSGRSDRRAGALRFVPQGSYVPTKTREWKYEFEEWLARVVAWRFGVSPVPIAKQQNRSTSEQLEESFTESGVRPLANFVARVVNRGIRLGLGIPEVEFRWGEDEVEDPAMAYARNVAYAHGGIQTLNQIRAAIGETPYPAEIGDRAFVLTASGPMFLDTVEEERKRKQEEAARFAASLAGGQPASPPPPETEAETEAGVAEKWASALAVYRARVDEDLRKRRRKLHKAARAGRPEPTFRSSALAPWMGPGFSFRKGEASPSPAQSAIERDLAAALAAWLDAQLPAVAAWAVGHLPEQTA